MNSIRLLLKKALPEKLIDLYRVLRFPSNRYAFFPYPLSYRQDGLATAHNSDFMRDERFLRAYQRGEETGSWGGGDIHWRAYIVCWAANQVMGLDGDFVECGVNRGGYARTIIDYLNFSALPKKFFLLDTFSGLVEKYISPEEKALGRKAGKAGGYEECYDAVVRTFAPFPNVEIIRGPVPDTLPRVTSEKICYLSIDMNNAEPEIAAGEYFWEKLTPGAIIVLDDYGHGDYIVQKRAWDAFAKRRNVMILPLPTEQALIIKY